uniref:Uncharacterized protein n=1 Tax=Cacopsylla melanoneura TaxID=428564 RepID=A0A8D8Q5U8_9HEMI
MHVRVWPALGACISAVRLVPQSVNVELLASAAAQMLKPNHSHKNSIGSIKMHQMHKRNYTFTYVSILDRILGNVQLIIDSVLGTLVVRIPTKYGTFYKHS